MAAAAIGVFSIIVYAFWYDKFLARWEKMIEGIRERNLGSEMKTNGSNEIVFAVKNRLHR